MYYSLNVLQQRTGVTVSNLVINLISVKIHEFMELTENVSFAANRPCQWQQCVTVTSTQSKLWQISTELQQKYTVTMKHFLFSLFFSLGLQQHNFDLILLSGLDESRSCKKHKSH